MALDKVDNATAVWNWTLARSFADEKLARDYVNFLFGHQQYEAAAQSWARFLGDHRAGYLETNWLYNGDFESEPEGLAFDWRMEGLGDDVEVARDPTIAHTGTHSLRIQFAGKTNVNFGQTFETSFVTPGTYRFEAFVRTDANHNRSRDRLPDLVRNSPPGYQDRKAGGHQRLDEDRTGDHRSHGRAPLAGPRDSRAILEIRQSDRGHGLDRLGAFSQTQLSVLSQNHLC